MVPRSCSEITIERRASLADAPAWSRQDVVGGNSAAEAATATYVTNYVGVAETDAKRGRRVDAGVHACYYRLA